MCHNKRKLLNDLAREVTILLGHVNNMEDRLQKIRKELLNTYVDADELLDEKDTD